jgi:hypothetical protein
MPQPICFTSYLFGGHLRSDWPAGKVRGCSVYIFRNCFTCAICFSVFLLHLATLFRVLVPVWHQFAASAGTARVERLHALYALLVISALLAPAVLVLPQLLVVLADIVILQPSILLAPPAHTELYLRVSVFRKPVPYVNLDISVLATERCLTRGLFVLKEGTAPRVAAMNSDVHRERSVLPLVNRVSQRARHVRLVRIALTMGQYKGPFVHLTTTALLEQPVINRFHAQLALTTRIRACILLVNA